MRVPLRVVGDFILALEGFDDGLLLVGFAGFLGDAEFGERFGENAMLLGFVAAEHGERGHFVGAGLVKNAFAALREDFFFARAGCD